MNMMVTILVTAAGGILSRSLAKCLRKSAESYTIIGIDADPTYLPLSPLDAAYIVPPFREPEQYLSAIQHLVKKRNIDFIFPQTDDEIELFARQGDFSSKTWLPPLPTILRCRDKAETNRLLAEAHVPVPLSVVVQGKDDLRKLQDIADHGGQFWVRSITGSGGKGAKLCPSLDEAGSWVEEQGGFGTYMASEYLPGRIFGWDSLWRNGECLFSQLKERLRYGAGNGPTLLSKSTTCIRTVEDECVEQNAQRAVQTIDARPDGLFAVDLREDRNGEACITEINAGRFLTTSTILCEKTGVLLPEAYLQTFRKKGDCPIRGRNPIPAEQYLIGAVLTEARILPASAFAVPLWSAA